MPKTFGAGQLRQVIKLQKKTATRDTFGQEVPTWTDSSSSVRADVRPISGSEVFSDPQMVGQEVKEFRIRYHSSLAVKDRIVYRDITYNIEEIIDEDERGRKQVIRAIKVTT